MTYEEWLNIIEELKNNNIDYEKLEQLKKVEVNSNINELLSPKLEALITTRFEKSINKIISNLENIFTDINYLDLILVNFKKEIKYINELISLKQLPDNKKLDLFSAIKEGTDNIYNILENEAKQIDEVGTFTITIKNNRINWSELI